jgi:hypothetical protein
VSPPVIPVRPSARTYTNINITFYYPCFQVNTVWVILDDGASPPVTPALQVSVTQVFAPFVPTFRPTITLSVTCLCDAFVMGSAA